MSKVGLVIGITGMDGSAMTRFLLSKGYSVVGTYRKNSKFNENDTGALFGGRVDLQYCEITDFHSVASLFKSVLDKYGKIDEIYLIAAQSHVGFSFKEPEKTVLTNGMSAYNFLENMRLMTPKTKLYFCATSELFGGDPTREVFNEKSSFECRSPYSIGKELGTRWITYYVQTYGLFACYGILFNHSNFDREKSFFIRKVTNGAARIASGKQKELVLGNLNFYRDEHWSDFGVEMMWKMLQRETPKTYVICKGETYHGEEFLNYAFNYFNLDWKDYVKISDDLKRPNEVVKLIGDCSLAKEELGWNPKRMSFKDHMELMCEYDFHLENNLDYKRPNVFELFP